MPSYLKVRFIYFSEKSLYLFLASGVFLFEAIRISEGAWVGDFWEHSAVIKELSENLVNPGNPILNNDTPHPFFSPYAVIVSVWAKTFNVNSITALTHFSFINLLLLLSGIYFFCNTLFDKNGGLIATITLFLSMFFWGENPLGWSGFYHVFDLHHVLPYPSTFAFTLSLFSLSIAIGYKDGRIKQILIAFLGAVVILTHPPTGVFFYSALIIYQLINKEKSVYWRFRVSVFYLITGVILSMIWPYYNVISLFVNSNNEFNVQSSWLYSGILKSYWPSLVCLPVMWYFKNNKAVLVITLWVFSFWCIFGLGYLTEIFGVSRIISNIMFCSFILVAWGIGFFYTISLKLGIAYSVLILCSFGYALSSNKWLIKNDLFNLEKERITTYYEKYSFISNFVRDDEVIFSDENSNWFLPSYGAKVISSHHPLYWIEDYYHRRNDVNTFFQSSISNKDRSLILEKYNPDFLLIDCNLNYLTDSMITYCLSAGTLVKDTNNLKLIYLNKPFR